MSDAEDTFECMYCDEYYNCPKEVEVFINCNLPEVRAILLVKYLDFLEKDATVRLFLQFDKCYTHADKYLIAIVFKYFLRLNIKPDMYTKTLFFRALHLALDICEEANELQKYAVYVWAQDIGTAQLPEVRKRYDAAKMAMFFELKFKTLICKEWCDELFKLAPNSAIFQRTREIGHSGVNLKLSKQHLGKICRVRSIGKCSKCINDNGQSSQMSSSTPVGNST